MTPRLKIVTAADIIRAFADTDPQRKPIRYRLAHVRAHIIIEALRTASVSAMRGAL